MNNQLLSLIAIVCGLSIAKYFIFRTKVEEIDSNKNPILRYIGAQYIMLLCGIVFFVVGIVEWFDPLNHKYSGNLLMLSYIPIALALCIFGFTTHLILYRVTINGEEIEVKRWPLKEYSVAINELKSIEEQRNKFVLHFNDGKHLTVYSMLSGYSSFLEKLKIKAKLSK